MSLRSPEFEHSLADDVIFDLHETLPVEHIINANTRMIFDAEGVPRTFYADDGGAVSDEKYIMFKIQHQTGTKKTALLNFFKDSNILWSRNTFTFKTSDDSVSYTVRLVEGTLKITKISSYSTGLYNFEMLLRIET